VWVLDVQLPDINGLQLQRELGGACPIIFITGYGDITMTVHAMKAGASDFLPKPLRDAELPGALSAADNRQPRQVLAASRFFSAHGGCLAPAYTTKVQYRDPFAFRSLVVH
jgi:FixJ family two-component response regulator